jgi:post-segregation antitoxin (ccd killing protein)
VRAAHTDAVHVRLTPSMRAALDAEARVAGVKLSAATRTALAVGLRALRTSADPEPPRPAGPASAMSAAA